MFSVHIILNLVKSWRLYHDGLSANIEVQFPYIAPAVMSVRPLREVGKPPWLVVRPFPYQASPPQVIVTSVAVLVRQICVRFSVSYRGNERGVRGRRKCFHPNHPVIPVGRLLSLAFCP